MLRFQVGIRCPFLGVKFPVFAIVCNFTNNVYYLKGHRECAKVHTIHKSTYR